MRMKHWIAAAACAASLATQSAPAPQWTITDLGALSTFGAVARGVNDMGDIVGYSSVPPTPGAPGGTHAFLWQDGLMIDLGVSPGTPPNSSYAQGVTVNDRGTILALNWMNDAWFVQPDGTWTPLGTHDPADMNRSGVVMGHYWGGAGSRTYIYNDGVVTDLGGFGGDNTVGFGMNDKGVVAGFAQFPEGNSHAFVYDGTLHDIGTLGGAASFAGDINNHGVVVGRSLDASGADKAFIWDERGGMRTLLDIPNSSASHINDHGVIIGFIGSRGFQYDDGVLTMLDDIPAVRAAGWSHLVPEAINNRGWIVGFGTKAGTNFGGAFLLMPK